MIAVPTIKIDSIDRPRHPLVIHEAAAARRLAGDENPAPVSLHAGQQRVCLLLLQLAGVRREDQHCLEEGRGSWTSCTSINKTADPSQSNSTIRKNPHIHNFI